MNLKIQTAELSDANQIIELISGYYSKSEQTSIALNIPSDSFKIYAEHVTSKAIILNQIEIAKLEDKIIGYLIWEDYCVYLHEGMKPNPDIFKIIQP